MAKVGMSLWLVVVIFSLLSHYGITASKHRRVGSLSSHSALPDKSVLDNLSQTQLQRLLQQISGVEKTETCKDDFGNMESRIIRTRDSIENGGTFLSALPEVGSAEECREKCCHYSGRGGRACDVAVYQLNREEEKPKCFLFSCYAESTSSKNFLCSFSVNRGFISFKRKVDIAPKQLLGSDRGTTPAIKVTPFMKSTSAPLPSVTIPTRQISTLNNPDTVSTCSKNCKKFEWKCDDGCCISGHSTCDGTFECSDQSDEVGCPTSVPNAMTTHHMPHVFDYANVTFAENRKKDKVDNKVHVLKNVSNSSADNRPSGDVVHEFKQGAAPVSPEAAAVLPLAIGLAITGCVLLMVACRIWVMKRKLRRRGKPLTMDEADYLINGMYL